MSELAFLDVDTQIDFVDPRGKLYARGAEAIEANLGRLVRHARQRGIPLVASVDAHAAQDPEFSLYPPHCIRGTPGQDKVPATRLADAVVVPTDAAAPLPDPRRGPVVLEKQEFDLFTSPAAEPVLAATGARTFAVFGVVTEVCVRYAVLGLLRRGYGVQVVTDAIWPIEAGAGERALEEMRAAGATETTTERLLAATGGEAMVTAVEVVEDRTPTARCDEGFLRLKRFVLRNTFSDGVVSRPYPCDVLSRRWVDAVAVVLWHRDPATGRVLVSYREQTRPAVWLRRRKQEELPHKDPRPYDTVAEIVAGVLETGDEGEAGILRRGAIEAREEAGWQVDPAQLRSLGRDGIFPSPGVTDEKLYLVAAEVDPAVRGAAEGDGSVQEEGHRLVTRDLRDAIRACRLGEINDAKTELGLLRLADQLGYLPQLDLFASDLPPALRERFDPLGVPQG